MSCVTLLATLTIIIMPVSQICKQIEFSWEVRGEGEGEGEGKGDEM